ncbi:hypothetical protein EDC01DRAFT_714577 [Geopyxis carbonaria]|nr:hypothetical protein EDC01DRAFT_714577 [Geopyxis carbonaria]
MNNAQFRKLLETPRPPPSNSDGKSTAPSATPALGSRMRSSIPMTPRSLTTSNNEFARQLAAHRASQQPTKKFRSSAAPKGTKFGEGYVDRAKELREGDDVEDERERRLQALQELVKEGAIDHDEYVKQTKLLGGDVSSTHLVKGLDFALLQRVKAGENVMDKDADSKKEEREEDLEDKLEKALETEVVAVERKKEKKKGEMPPPPKTRAEILAELKRQRQAAKEAANPVLGSKFRRITEPKEKPKKEEEEEVKVKHVMGADGKVKRKIKRSDKERERQAKAQLEMPAPDAAPLGMMPPPPPPSAKPAEPEEDEDDDIFADAGEYDPLAGIADDDEDSSEDEDKEPKKRQKSEAPATDSPAPASPSISDKPVPEPTSMPPPPRPKINYFNETEDTNSDDYKAPDSASSLIASNPDLAAALQRASKLGKTEESEQEKRRKAMTAAHERDSYDIDMGFGGSTNFDDDDDDEGGAKGGAGPKKRKRGGGPKKKGDKNDAGVVGKIVEEKYGKGSKA